MSSPGLTPSNSNDPATPKVATTAALIRPSGAVALSPLAGTASAPVDTADGVGLGRYIHAFRRRWLLSLVIAVPLSALATYCVWTLQPQRYTATALVHILPIDPRLIFTTADQSLPGAHNTFDSFKKTQRLRLKQRHVIVRALDPAKHPKMQNVPVLREQDDPVAWVELNLSVTFPEDAELMYVSLTASDPTGLHELVNSIVEEYYDEVVGAERRRKMDRVNTLRAAVEASELDLRNKRNVLKGLAEQLGTGNKDALTDVQRNALNQWHSFVQQLAHMKSELVQAKAELEHREGLQNAADQEVPVTDAELAAVSDLDAVTRQLKFDQLKILRQIDDIKTRFKSEKSDELLKEPVRQLETTTEKLATRRNELRALLVEQKRLDSSTELDDLRRQVSLLTSKYTALDAEAKKLQSDAKATGRTSIEAEMLSTEIDANTEILNGLRAEFERTKVEVQTTKQDQQNQDLGSRIRVMQEALPARPADSKIRIASTIGAGGLSFLMPFVVLVFLDASKNRISTGAEVTQAVGLSVIGAVPILPRRVIRRLNGPSESDRYWRSLLSESVDSIAAVLLHGSQPGTSRVIMVSSANAGEGKTTLAAHLAVSLARAGRHPVLVDFDLRRPALHRVFGVGLQPGVNEILRDGHDLDAALQATQVPNLMMLSAGRWSRTGLAGLVAADLQALFTRLRSEFDFVVVDACPILPVVDTRLIGQHVDAVLLSVLRDVSRAPKLRAACELLDLFGIPVLGVVVTGSSEEIYKDSRYEPLSEAQAV